LVIFVHLRILLYHCWCSATEKSRQPTNPSMKLLIHKLTFIHNTWETKNCTFLCPYKYSLIDIYIYIYIYIWFFFAWVCVCVCIWEKERERESVYGPKHIWARQKKKKKKKKKKWQPKMMSQRSEWAEPEIIEFFFFGHETGPQFWTHKKKVLLLPPHCQPPCTAPQVFYISWSYQWP